MAYKKIGYFGSTERHRLQRQGELRRGNYFLARDLRVVAPSVKELILDEIETALDDGMGRLLDGEQTGQHYVAQVLEEIEAIFEANGREI